MVAQTIGGGGGIGGSGDASAKSKGDATSSTNAIAIGGSGGGAGSGGTSVLTNTGGILTLGDAGYGLFGQSIGGGGGKGGGAAATQSGGTLAFTLKVGGNGGGGGDGGDVTATNSGSIATFGADATGVLAHSIGGGGGAGGKAASTLGGKQSTGSGGNGNTQTGLSKGLNLNLGDLTANGGIDPNANVTQLTAKKDFKSLLSMGFSLIGSDDTGSGDDAGDLNDLSEASGDASDGSSVESLAIDIAVGGAGGNAGSGVGTVTVTNTGTIGTVGASSDAIFAQSVGGGGGTAGAASASSSSSDLNLAFGVGGTGGAAGSGGTVDVYNSGGSIITTGGIADGIVAQSVGGGGGKGGVAGSKTGLLNGLPVSIGGDGGANGNGGAVTVQSATANSAVPSILTQSHRSIGILAQSIGGGGGIVKTLSTDGDTGGGADLNGDTFQVGLTFGGKTGSRGNGGTATVNLAGSIITRGRDAHGVLAQSIGGGGGLVTGALVTGTTFFGAGTMTGDGGAVTVAPTTGEPAGATIATSGDGAIGIWAQSIAGGGGVAGDTGTVGSAFGTLSGGGYSGSGGTVSVSLNNGGAVTTTGDAAMAIFAQSIGGGGGHLVSGTTILTGTAGGSGSGGAVTIDLGLDGSAVAVTASGASAPAIWAQSAGGTPGVITIATGARTRVWGGTGGFGYGLILDGGTANVLTNAGTIGSASGNAILSNSAQANTTITNSGTISGNQSFAAAASETNRERGTVEAGRTLDLAGGTLTNHGTVTIGASGRTSTSRLDGDLVQVGGGRLAFDADFVGGTADRLYVRGDASLGGGIAVRPISLVPGSVTVLTATGAFTSSDLADATASPVFGFAGSVVPTTRGTSLTLTSSANFRTGELTREQQGLADHLQRIWDGDHPETLAHGFAALATVDNAAGYGTALESLASREVGAIATARLESSRAFVGNMQSCPVFVGASLMLQESDCAWGRALTGHLDHDGSGATLGFDADSSLLQFGGQKQIRDGIFAAGAVAWDHSSLDANDGLASSDGDSWMLGGGVKYQSGPLLASAMLDLGYGQFDTTRNIEVGTQTFRATGSPDASNIGLHGRAAYELLSSGFYLRPSLDLDARYLSLDGYDESGAGDLNLTIERSDGWVLTATPAVEIGSRLDLQNGTVLRPFASAGVSLISGNDWSIDAHFRNAPADAGSFTAGTDKPSTVGMLGAGVTVMTAGDLDLTLQYSGGFADNYTAQAGALKATWRF